MTAEKDRLLPSDRAEIRAIIASGMWDGAWAKVTILRLLDRLDTLDRRNERPTARPADADDPRYQDRLWDGTA